MSLFEEVLAARKRAEESKVSCVNCIHLYWIDEKTPFCKEVDKFILPEFPPTKCEHATLTSGRTNKAGIFDGQVWD